MPSPIESNSALTDAELIRLTVEQDRNHFAAIVAKYEKPIFWYVCRLLNFNHHDAEDVTSETFLKAFVNLNGFNQSLKFSSWLYRIAHNEAVNLIKKKSHYFNVAIETIDLPDDFDWNKPRPEDLEKVLGKLSFEDRNLLTLFYLEERSIKEIAEILKTSENNIAVKLNRVRNKAKKLANPHQT